MQWLIEIYGFLAVLIRASTLAFEGIATGGVIFMTLCLKRDEAPLIRQACARLLRGSAILLAIAAASGVALSALVLHNSAPDFTWADALNTTFSLSGLLIVMMALAISCLARQQHATALLALSPDFVLAAALTGSHAFARVDDRPLLLLLTALHHLGMAAWIGGLPYLLITLVRAGDEQAAQVARRFSRLAITSVIVLCSGIGDDAKIPG